MKTEFNIIESYPLTKEKLKQKLYVILYYLIAFVLLISGVSKIINPESLLNTLNTTLSFLNENIIILFAAVLPVLEIIIGLMLLLKIKMKETLIAAVILFSAFLLFAVYGTIKGFDVDCGCFGTVIKSEFGIWIIVRNLMLLGLTLVFYEKEKMDLLKDQNKSINYSLIFRRFYANSKKKCCENFRNNILYSYGFFK